MDHATVMAELEKLCFEVYNPAINRQIEVFRMTQSKTETAAQVGLRVQNSYMHSDTANAGSNRIECLLILRFITDESALKELHKDIAGNMRNPKVLMEAITAIERSAQTLDFQLTGSDRARRANNVQNAQCHTCQQAGHTKEQCTVPKDKLSCKHCKKKGIHNTNS